jgi:hypothetical protein
MKIALFLDIQANLPVCPKQEAPGSDHPGATQFFT